MVGKPGSEKQDHAPDRLQVDWKITFGVRLIYGPMLGIDPHTSREDLLLQLAHKGTWTPPWLVLTGNTLKEPHTQAPNFDGLGSHR